MVRDEETMELRGTYTSLQQEVEVKTKKLKKVRDCGYGPEGLLRDPFPFLLSLEAKPTLFRS